MLDSNKIEHGARANKNDFCIDLFYKMKKSKFKIPESTKKGNLFKEQNFLWDINSHILMNAEEEKWEIFQVGIKITV